MATLNISSVLTARIVLRNKLDGAESTIYLSSESLEQIKGFTDLSTKKGIYPILKNITPINYQVADFLPQQQTLTINLNNDFHSIGYTRKFLDLLEKYTLIKQRIELFYIDFAVDEIVDISDCFNLNSRVFAGTIESVPANLVDKTLSLNCQSYNLPKTVFNKEINVTDFPNAPTDELGKYLPIVFGNCVTPAFCVNTLATSTNHNSGATSQDVAKFAFATSLVDYQVGIKSNLYVKQYDRVNNIAINANHCNSALSTLANAYGGSFFPAVMNNYYTNINYISNAGSAIVTDFIVEARGSNLYTDTLKGDIIFAIYYKGKKTQEIQVPKANYPDLKTNGASVDISVKLKEPAVVANFADFGISITQKDPSTTGDTRLYLKSYSYTSGGANYNLIANEENSFPSSSGTSAPKITLYGASMRFNRIASTNGFYHEFLEIGCKDGSFKDYINNLDISVNTQGLLDDGGSLTGTVGSLINKPHDQINLLLSTWNGAYWDFISNAYDKTVFQSTLDSNTKIRLTSFASEGKAFADELIAKILKNAMYKMIPIKPSGSVGSDLKNLSLYAYGNKITETVKIKEDDILSFSYEIRDSKSIINDFVLLYNPSYLGLDIKSLLSQSGSKSFQGAITKVNDTSKFIYGAKDLADNQFEYLIDSISANNIADILLGLYSNPLEYYVFDVPYYKYKSLKLMDVVEITNAHLPSFYGSDLNPDLSFYDGVESSEVANYETLASTRRCQIDSITYGLTDQVPTIKLAVRVITNAEDLT